jgi:hypothetical protein
MLKIVLFTLIAIQWNMISAQNESDTTVSSTMKTNDHFLSTNSNRQPLTTLLCDKRDKPYFLPHKSSISQFYVCVKGQLFLLNCPSGYQFDSELDQCVRKTIEYDIEKSKLFIYK